MSHRVGLAAGTRARLFACGCVAVLVAGCIGEPVNSPEEGYTGRQPNHAPPQSMLGGRVLNLVTGEPIAGARIADESSGVSTISNSTGAYLLPAIRANHASLVTSSAGFDTSRVLVQLNGGDVRLDVRLRAAVQQ